MKRRHSVPRRVSTTVALVTLLVATHPDAIAQRANLKWKVHNVGKVRQVVNNTGSLNSAGSGYFRDYRSLLNTEYPAGSGEEHLVNGGIWVSAIREQVIGDTATVFDTLCSVTYSETIPDREFFPSEFLWDSIYTVARGDTIDIGDPNDPYWPRYAAVSDQDFVCRYYDYGEVSKKVLEHEPMYLDVIQTSYAWASSPLDEVIVFTYYVISTKYRLHQVYLNSWVNSSVGFVEVDYGLDDYSYYDAGHKLAVTLDIAGGADATAFSPLGRKVYPPPKQRPADSVYVTYKWYDIQDGGGNNIQPGTDVDRWLEISEHTIKDPQPPIKQGTKDFVAYGPYELGVGDTLKFIVSLIVGNGLDAVVATGETMDELILKNFQIPSPPPPPPLHVTTDARTVTLDWMPRPGEVNPEEYADANRSDSAAKPFAGYRVYKSTQGSSGPWTLLAEYDLPDDGYGQNTGLQYTFSDQGLLNNIEYYYAVTAFSRPDENFPSQESSINATARTVTPGPAPPATIGQVAVVPNPYRGDIAYQNYNPPWERPEGSRKRWMEQDRRIQFINLPANCEIRIYTVSGDLVQTIAHNDPAKGYEDWNLTSRVGQAVSSGLYLFTAQDLVSGEVQVGKFVIIK